MGHTGETLRVAFVDQTGDEIGGAQESFALLLQHLPKWIEPRIVLFHEGKYAQRLRDLGFIVSVIPISAGLLSIKREHTGAGSLIHAPTAIMSLAHWFRDNRIRLVYTHTVKAHFLGAAAARLAGIRCVMHLRDILEGAPLAALRTVGAVCSAERIAISHKVAAAYNLPRTTVLPNPVDIESYRHLPSRAHACEALGVDHDPEVLTVGIVGRINRWKGHDRFLRIADKVRADRPVRFLIVGAPIFRDQDFANELRVMVTTLGLEARTTFVPWVDDVANAYAALDVHANCSDREPFGRSVIEAAACGVPSICFSDAGVAELLTDGADGRVVPAGDEHAFAAALSSMLRGTTARDLGLEARKTAERCGAESHGARVAEVLVRAAA